jgi:hypothetical protein
MWYNGTVFFFVAGLLCTFLSTSVSVGKPQPRVFYTRYANMEGCEIILEPRWINLGQENFDAKKFGGKWILVGVITFRKTTKQPVYLDNLALQWMGEKIPCLFGSLYKGHPGKIFLPLEENLICDSLWDARLQMLKLIFHEKQTLGPTSMFYMVLTVPPAIEPIVKRGSFKLVADKLPAPFNEIGTKGEELLLEIQCQF